jgi:hypothetical protein
MDEARKSEAQKLISRPADALCEYHGERPGNFACHAEAAMILTKAGPLKDFQADDFFEVVSFAPPSKGKTARSGRFAKDVRARISETLRQAQA